MTWASGWASAVILVGTAGQGRLTSQFMGPCEPWSIRAAASGQSVGRARPGQRARAAKVLAPSRQALGVLVAAARTDQRIAEQVVCCGIRWVDAHSFFGLGDLFGQAFCLATAQGRCKLFNLETCSYSGAKLKSLHRP